MEAETSELQHGRVGEAVQSPFPSKPLGSQGRWFDGGPVERALVDGWMGASSLGKTQEGHWNPEPPLSTGHVPSPHGPPGHISSVAADGAALWESQLGLGHGVPAFTLPVPSLCPVGLKVGLWGQGEGTHSISTCLLALTLTHTCGHLGLT